MDDSPSVTLFGPLNEVAAGVDTVVVLVTCVVDMTVVVLSVPRTPDGWFTGPSTEPATGVEAGLPAAVVPSLEGLEG